MIDFTVSLEGLQMVFMRLDDLFLRSLLIFPKSREGGGTGK